MKRKAKVGLLLLLVVVLAVSVTGCRTVEKYSLTYRVWGTGDWRKFSEPAPNPNLALFEANNGLDELVEYDALVKESSSVKRQAYNLHESESLIRSGKRPILIALTGREEMKRIPVVPALPVDTNQLIEVSKYALLVREGRGFTMYRGTTYEQTYDLPVYRQTSGTPMRIALTPFAAAGDAVMAGAAIALMLIASIGPGR